MVDEAAVAHSIAAASAIEEIGCVAHAFHAAGDDDFGAACKKQIVRQHDGLHAGAAHLVDGDGAG